MSAEESTPKEIKPGTKVDIRIMQEVNRESNGGEDSTTYISSVFDLLEDGSIELNMPTRAGRILLLPTKICYEFVFTTDNGLFKAEGVIDDRYKREHFYLLRVRFTSALEKFQRREYYRLECMIPLKYITLDESAGNLKKMSEIHDKLQSDVGEERVLGQGTILDISGGGIRFVTEKDLGDVHYLILQFPIELAQLKKNIEIIGEIISSYRVENTDKNCYRIKILFKDSRCQEKIIRYIFDEERKIRKKEQGV